MREFVNHKRLKYGKRQYRLRDLRRPSPCAMITLQGAPLGLGCPARKMRGKWHRHNHKHKHKVRQRRRVSLTHVRNSATLRSRMDVLFPPRIFPHHRLMNENYKEKGPRIPRKRGMM